MEDMSSSYNYSWHPFTGSPRSLHTPGWVCCDCFRRKQALSFISLKASWNDPSIKSISIPLILLERVTICPKTLSKSVAWEHAPSIYAMEPVILGGPAYRHNKSFVLIACRSHLRLPPSMDRNNTRTGQKAIRIPLGTRPRSRPTSWLRKKNP